MSRSPIHNTTIHCYIAKSKGSFYSSLSSRQIIPVELHERFSHMIHHTDSILALSDLILSTFANITHIKHSLLLDPLPLQRLFQQRRWLQDLFFSKDPSAPMHTKRLFTFRVDKDIDTVKWIRVQRREHVSRVVGADGDQAEIERSAMFTNLLKGRATWQVLVFLTIVVFIVGNLGNGAVTSITMCLTC
jgi:hypothetical protein